MLYLTYSMHSCSAHRSQISASETAVTHLNGISGVLIAFYIKRKTNKQTDHTHRPISSPGTVAIFGSSILFLHLSYCLLSLPLLHASVCVFFFFSFLSCICLLDVHLNCYAMHWWYVHVFVWLICFGI